MEIILYIILDCIPNNVADILVTFGLNLPLSDGQQPSHLLHNLAPPPYVLHAFNKECSRTLGVRKSQFIITLSYFSYI